MRVIIVRHGKAEADPPEASGRDEDRRLKKRGRRQARWLGECFADAPPSLILSSGHERAIATAQIIHERIGAPLEVEARLQLGHSASDGIEVIAEHAERCSAGGLMLVGHNPQLAQLVWVLTNGAPAAEADLRTGEAVALELNPGAPVGQAMVVARVREDDEA